ncbi:MAG: nitronate monooxygenase [Candidatus Lokiarchaeota archaeon]|nr:nitronate monooxygenase [Candidatus Lokiarchaeota archaeon]
MIWRTKITELTKTKYPLIMAAFARLSSVEFAAAFSNSGGLGMITAMNYDLQEFKSKIIKMQTLSDKPFGINITVVPPGVSGIHDKISQEDYLKYVEIAIEQGINIFTTSAFQANFIGKRIQEAGCHWFHKCALIRHALSAEKAGAEAITIIGMEAAGFKNPYQHTTLMNLTFAKKLLKIPIIAAGGIGEARGFIGALAMGADAVCLGTAILSTEESPLNLLIKEQWLHTDILNEEYHKALYHFSLKGTRVPSPAIAFQKEIIPLKKFIENMMDEAELIVKSWKIDEQEFRFS